MKRRSFYNITISVIFLVIICFSYSCVTTKQTVDSKDLSYLYNPVKNSLNPRYSIFNQAEEVSVLSVKFFNNDLFFNEANPKGVPMAQLYLAVNLYDITQGRVLADTAYYNLEIVKNETSNEYLYNIPLKVKRGAEYVAEIKLVDRIRQFMVQAFVPFNTTSDLNRYNFFVRGHFMHNQLLNPVVRRNEYLNLLYSRKPIDSIFISYFQADQNIPYPPSMVLPERSFGEKPDTIIGLQYSDTLPLMLPRKGVYFCTTGKGVNEGYSFFNFGVSFPSMTTPEEMIEPLAYLASENEMSELHSSARPKVALDNFWEGCGGNVEKARELIRIYYTRAIYANSFFTSYKEGWRTDRGMVYLIYGPPDKVYKNPEEETWGYKKASVKSSWGTRYQVKEDYLFFKFKKKDNKFTDNDYSLSRTETVVSYWDQAVLSWRKGVVFRLDNPKEF